MMLKLLMPLSLFVLVTAKVKVTSQDYTCKGDVHHVESKFAMENPDCEQYWSFQDISIGMFLGSSPKCHSPCQKLTAGKIILTDCVNITLAVICTKAHLETIEYRIHFNGKMIPQSMHNSVKRAHIGAYTSIGALILFSCLLCARWLHHKKETTETEADVIMNDTVTDDIDC